jgi:hypothetical protein
MRTDNVTPRDQLPNKLRWRTAFRADHAGRSVSGLPRELLSVAPILGGAGNVAIDGDGARHNRSHAADGSYSKNTTDKE